MAAVQTFPVAISAALAATHSPDLQTLPFSTDTTFSVDSRQAAPISTSPDEAFFHLPSRQSLPFSTCAFRLPVQGTPLLERSYFDAFTHVEVSQTKRVSKVFRLKFVSARTLSCNFRSQTPRSDFFKISQANSPPLSVHTKRLSPFFRLGLGSVRMESSESASHFPRPLVMTAIQSFSAAWHTNQFRVSPSTFSVQSLPVAASPAVASRQSFLLPSHT